MEQTEHPYDQLAKLVSNAAKILGAYSGEIRTALNDSLNIEKIEVYFFYKTQKVNQRTGVTTDDIDLDYTNYSDFKEAIEDISALITLKQNAA